jgi:FeS assembly SUF system protein
MIDEEYERLKKRRILPVLNQEAEQLGEFVLEGPGERPDAPHDPNALRPSIVEALRTVHDPEIPVNIYDLGLVYELDLDADGTAHVKMTLTAPGCPVAGQLVSEVHDRLRSVPGVRYAKTELVWDPPWTRDRMTEAAKLELGLLF